VNYFTEWQHDAPGWHQRRVRCAQAENIPRLIRGNAALRSLSERSEHQMSAYRERIYEYTPWPSPGDYRAPLIGST